MPPRTTPPTPTRDYAAAPAGAAPAERPRARPRLGRPLPAAGRLGGPGPAAVPPLRWRWPRFCPPASGGLRPRCPSCHTRGVAGAGRSGRRKRRSRREGRTGGEGPVRRLSLSEIFQPYLTRKYGSPGEKRLTRALLKSNSSACCAGKIALAASQRAGT